MFRIALNFATRLNALSLITVSRFHFVYTINFCSDAPRPNILEVEKEGSMLKRERKRTSRQSFRRVPSQINADY